MGPKRVRERVVLEGRVGVGVSGTVASHLQKTTPVTAEETPVVALSLVQPTKKRQHAHRIHMNKLMYILLRCALSANTTNSRVVVLTGSSPSEHVAMLAH